MHGLVSAPLANPAATTFNAQASVTNFKVNLFGFVTVWFDQLKFTAQTGAKPDVIADIHPGDEGIAFGGPLEFVNDLRSIIPSNGFSDPPSLSVTPERHQRGLLRQRAVAERRHLCARTPVDRRQVSAAVRRQARRSAVQFRRTAAAFQPHGFAARRRRILRHRRRHRRRTGNRGRARIRRGAYRSISASPAAASKSRRASISTGRRAWWSWPAMSGCTASCRCWGSSRRRSPSIFSSPI